MRKGEEVERVFSSSHGAEQEVSGPLTQKFTQKLPWRGIMSGEKDRGLEKSKDISFVRICCVCVLNENEEFSSTFFFFF